MKHKKVNSEKIRKLVTVEHIQQAFPYLIEPTISYEVCLFRRSLCGLLQAVCRCGLLAYR